MSWNSKDLMTLALVLAVFSFLVTCTSVVLKDDSVAVPKGPVWCARGSVQLGNSRQTAEVCAESRNLCDKVRSVAIKYGSMGGLKSVSTCERY